MPLIDSHCHLDFDVFDSDRDAVMTRAAQAGITDIVIPGARADQWNKLIQLRNEQDAKKDTNKENIGSIHLHIALGLHPYFIESHQIEQLDQLEHRLIENKAIAVGECGLDFYDKNQQESVRKQQIAIFLQHLEIARKTNLPLIIHSRKANDTVLKYIRRYPDLRGVIHSFSGSQQQAEQFIKHGFYLGFGGPVTYTRARKLRELVSNLPLEALLLETDAPDQPDSMHRGKRNEPGFLPIIAETFAILRQIPLEQIAEQTSSNAQRLFGLNPPVNQTNTE